MLDWQAILKGGGGLAGIGAGLGLPSCLTNLGMAALALLPSSLLNEIAFAAEEAQAKIDAWLANLNDYLSKKFGLDITITPNGEISIVSRNSLMSAGGLAGALGFVAGAAAMGAGLLATGAAIAKNIEGIADCIKQFADGDKFSGAGALKSSQMLPQTEYEDLIKEKAGPTLDEMDRLKKERERWADLQRRIEGEKKRRLTEGGPLFTCAEVEIDGNSVHLSSLGFDVSCAPEDDVDKELIRLVYGPPLAREGQFILSNDGLYYDSQSSEASGVTQVLIHLDKRKSNVPLSERWQFDYDPNLGGKGVQYSSKSLSYYIDTIFDPIIIDDDATIRKYYEADHFLEVLESQKAKRIYDLSAHISDFIGDDAGTALIQNAKQSLYSEIAIFEGRIRKRKKQIELAVKMPIIYGGTPIFDPGEVPLNDFSYLQQFNFANDIHKQKALVLDQADVTGVISPVTPKFVISEPKDEVHNLEHMYVANIGKGEIIYSNSASSTIAPKLSITDRITTNNLFAVYNYLESNIVNPSSVDFNVANCASHDVYNNAQLVSTEASSVFTSGISIPKLTGVAKHIASSLGGAHYTSSVGNFVKLPETPEFYDLTYKAEGFTFETWMYVPNLTKVQEGWTDTEASSTYRLILGNENAGMTSGLTAQTNPERLEKDLGDGFVKGMIMGFTRDRRITKNLDHSYAEKWNQPTSSLAFFVAPTQAINDTSVGLIHNGCSHDPNPNFYNFKVDASAQSSGGKQLLLSSADQFVLASFVMNPSKDQTSLYINGDLMVTSSLEYAFGRDKYETVQVPSFHKLKSFNYVPSNLSVSADQIIQGGPKLGTYFTPTILGGGYTDGIGGKGFMGDKTFGAISGLRGYLGSTKFYDRALEPGEILNNYNAQKEVFENINTPSTHTFGGGI